MNRLELDLRVNAAVDRPWRDRDRSCPRCMKRLDALGTHDHYVCPMGHQFTAKQLAQWPVSSD